MPQTGTRDPAKEKFWRETLERQRRSGLSQAAFCRQEGLNANTLSSWKEIIEDRDAELKDGKPRLRKRWQRKTGQVARVKPRPAFVPLLTNRPQESITGNMHFVAEVAYAGASIRIYSDADAATLEALFAALKELAP